MLRIPVVLAVTARLIRYFSLTLLVPLAVATYDQSMQSVVAFLVACLTGTALGFLGGVRFKPPRLFHRPEAMAVVAFTWLFAALIACIPYMLLGIPFVDALFESMSGMTTTGATILTDFTQYERSFFLWRAMTQWFGGLGVIALFVVILPRLGIAGRQLFFAEASTAPSDAVSPQIRRSASALWILYGSLTLLCAVLLATAGMSAFDAVLHALTTLSAGGFSPSSTSIAGYGNAWVEWVLIIFMFLAGASFPLQLRFASKKPFDFFKDDELLFYLAITLIGAITLTLTLGGWQDEDALRIGLFQATSLISSTGFASIDYNLWPDSTRAILLILMIIGGCAGSAAGGPKAIRHLLVGRTVLREIRQSLNPRAVLPLLYRGRSIPDQVLRAVFSLVSLYIGGYIVLAAILIFLDLDPVSAFTASIACFGNIGPGFETVGPMANFAHLSQTSKLVLTAAMWVGRLEIMTVLALFHPSVWKMLSLQR